MRILAVHNRYNQAGGEDVVFEQEVGLLREAGHDVCLSERRNQEIVSLSDKIRVAAQTIYNPGAASQLEHRIHRERPDIVHVHNFFPQYSPSIFFACKKNRVPVVWTIHNFRLACANGLLLRDGHVCELCINGSAFNALRYRCYRNSIFGSACVATMIAVHRSLQTWATNVDAFIALTEFSKAFLIKCGIPARKIHVKHNFAPDGGKTLGPARRGAVFCGRISQEKGLDTLLKAWNNINEPLSIIGDGPDRSRLEELAPKNVNFLGRLSRIEALAKMREAQVLIVPSVWYEHFPMVIAEAKSMGVATIASRMGSLAEIVHDGEDGFLFDPGDSDDLRSLCQRLFAEPAHLERAGKNARVNYEQTMTPSASLLTLTNIYNSLLQN